MSVADLERVLASRARCASPFLMLGDPTPELSFDLACAAIDAGAEMLELGIPYSDPCADGPPIQAACLRSFAGGTTVGSAIGLLGRIARARAGVALNLLVYGNLIHARGFDRFCAEVADAGAATVLAPDVPLEECDALRQACERRQLGCVQLVAPRTSAERLARLDEAATGFLYLTGHQGVTGAVRGDATTRRTLVQRVVAAVRNPVCLGFGLSAPTHLTTAFEAGARMAVVGSSLARVIGDAPPERVVTDFLAAWRPLQAAANETTNDER